VLRIGKAPITVYSQEACSTRQA